MRRLEGHRGKVLCVAYAPDGQTLASGSSGKIIKLWDVRTGKARATLRGFDYAAFCLAFSPDGGTLASGHSAGWRAPGVVRLWDVAGGREPTSLAGFSRHSWLRAVAFSPDRADLAAASGDRTNSGHEGGVRVCDAASGAERWGLRQPGGGVLSLAYAPDGGTLALGTLAVGVRLFDPASGRERV